MVKVEGVDERKEDILMLLMDFLMEIEIPFLDGMSGKFYPKLTFMQSFMERVVDLSTMICSFLVRRKEKVVCIFLNTILKMITQILEKQYEFIRAEVTQRVEIAVQDIRTKNEFLAAQNAELQTKLNNMQKQEERQL